MKMMMKKTRRLLAMAVLGAIVAMTAYAKINTGVVVPQLPKQNPMTWKQLGPLRYKANFSHFKTLQGSDGQVYLQVDLEADSMPNLPKHRVPTHFTVVLDRSGSMSSNDVSADEEETSPAASTSKNTNKKTVTRSSIYQNPLKQMKDMISSGSSADKQDNEKDSKKELKVVSKRKQKVKSADEYRQQFDSNIAQVQAFESELDDQLEGDQDLFSKTTVATDPFRARLIEGKHLVFYRRVWANQKMSLQGFVVDFKTFMQNAFENSSFANLGMTDFAQIRIIANQTSLINFGNTTRSTTNTLWQNPFGYPLNGLTWQLAITSLPTTLVQKIVIAITVLLIIIAGLSLLSMYRSTVSQVLISQKRQDFVSAVTHELKTPLTSIRLYSEMLQEGWATDDNKKREYYDHISSESHRLSRLIDRVLQLAALERDTHHYQLITGDPAQDFTAIMTKAASHARNNGFTVTIDCPSELPTIVYDADATEQILTALTENSIKFCRASNQKQIIMTVLTDQNHVTLSFEDRGPGVPEKAREEIFEQFHRLENELTRSTKGTGIGLAIAKMLATGMHAKIAAQNTKPTGLRITLIFDIINYYLLTTLNILLIDVRAQV